METDFLASANHFFIYFPDIPASERFFSVYRKRIFEQIFQSGSWKRIFSPVETVYFIWDFFYGNLHWHKRKTIFKDRTYSCEWEMILWLVESHFLSLTQIFLKGSFIPDSGNPLFSSKEKVLFFIPKMLALIYSCFLSCKWNPLFKL